MKQPKTFLENKWLAIGLIVLISAVVYYNSLHAPFIFDDIPKIIENPDIKQLENVKTKLIYPYDKEYYNFKRNDPSRPLTYLTFTLNYHFGKLNTFGYHLFNILMHIFNAVLIFFLTRKIILYIYKKDSHFFSLFVALFFAVHPINTEVAAYVYHRSDSLLTFFYILSLLFFIKTIEKKKCFYIFSLGCFILAFSAKQTAATLPAIVLVFDYIFLSDCNVSKVLARKNYHIPFWLILIVFLLFRLLYFGGIGDKETDAYSRWSNFSYPVIQPYVVLRYLGLLLIPTGLCIDHFIEPVKTVFELKILASFFSIMVLFILIYKVSRKKTDASKLLLFSALWFFITLFPTSSFLPIRDAMAERRLYLSGFGFFLAIVSLYFLILRKGAICSRSPGWILLGLAGIHIFLLGAATVKRNQLYRNPVLLWQDAISMYPENFRAHYNLSFLYYERREYVKAIEETQKALKINPDSAKARINLGALYRNQKEHAKAIEETQKALKINPDSAQAHTNLGALYYDRKEYAKAIRKYQKALKINPDYVIALYNLGITYYHQKEYEKALRKFKSILRLNPNNENAKTMIKTVKRHLNTK
jgi:tetratricopeptide (TPR) repeat protein